MENIKQTYTVISQHNVHGDDLVQQCELDAKDANDLQKDPKVLGVCPNIPLKLVTPIEVQEIATTLETYTWGLKAIGVQNSNLTGKGATVAVLDTGIDLKHEVFANKKIITKDFTNSAYGIDDKNGHGTHCAATIAGRSGDNTKNIGVAPDADLIIGKVLGDNGLGDTSAILQAMQWATRQGADVISMSLGADFGAYAKKLATVYDYPIDLAYSVASSQLIQFYDTYRTLVQFLKIRGVRIIAATGNSSRREIGNNYEINTGPLGYSADIAVAASDINGNIANFSNNGADLTCPGVDVLSAAPGGGYVKMSGTSMATPHAAGIYALFIEDALKQNGDGSFNPEYICARVLGHAKRSKLSSFANLANSGAGLGQVPMD